MDETTAALFDGGLAAAQMFEPFVERAVRRGGHVWQQSSARGRTSYTVFAARRDRLAADPEPFRRVVRAIGKTQRWVAAQAPAVLAETIAPYFPALDRDVLAGALARYQAQDVWGDDPVVSEDGFGRLRRALLASRYLSRPVPFEDCVDNRLAEEVMAS